MKRKLPYIAVFAIALVLWFNLPEGGASDAPVIGQKKARAQQNVIVPREREQIKLSFAPLVKQTAPAVVNIYAKKIVRQRMAMNPFFNDPFFQQFFGFNNLLRDRVENALGSGVIVRPDGLIVSNNHVVGNAQEIVAVLADGRELEAEVVVTDERTDLAVLRVDPGDAQLPYIQMGNSDSLEVGDLVLVIGNPFGVGQTVTSGIVSAVARTDVGITDYSFFIQTDAAINPGNSGGALIDMEGHLVGVNTAIYSRSGGSLGIGFAIPVNMVNVVVAAALEGGVIRRPWLGAEMQRITSDIASSMGLPGTRGALVTNIFDGSPADRAGLAFGDVILAIDGKQVADPESLRFRLATRKIGSETVLDVQSRGNARKKVTVRVEPPPETPARDTTVLQGQHPFAGVEVSNINPALLEEMNEVKAKEGVVITGVRGLNRIGMRPGDVIYNVNGSKIASVDQLEKVLQNRTPRWRLQFMRGQRIISVVSN